ncbi:4-phosphoerythronate dehydrogenase [candidate division WOR-3 bacterium]|nr:4-phosphoerythronate dehydrogenase [candidate division WOR-3 bacterium]
MRFKIKIVGDENIAFLKETFSRLGEVTALPSHQITNKNIKDAEVLLVRSPTRVDQELLKESSVKFAGTATIGTDHIDTEYLEKRGIILASAPGVNSNAVAEYLVACLLVLAKRKKFTLQGKTIAVIGVGNIGSKVVKKCRALGMIPLLNDPPHRRKTKAKKYLPLEALFESDIITLHTPLTYKGRDATYHMVDKKFLSKMKQGAILINTSRGEVIDELALLNSIEKLKALVLDVWENEPNINIELLKKVELGTPHIAGYSIEGKIQATAMLYKALCKFLNKEDKWSPTSKNLLPLSKKKLIEVDCSCKRKEIMGKVVNEIYDVEDDDYRLRKIIELPLSEGGKYFDELRKSYKLRREFHNVTLILKNCSPELMQKFKGLGFLCSHQ